MQSSTCMAHTMKLVSLNLFLYLQRGSFENVWSNASESCGMQRCLVIEINIIGNEYVESLHALWTLESISNNYYYCPTGLFQTFHLMI